MVESINKSPLHCGQKTKETNMLHPQARALLRLIEEKGVPPVHTLTPAQARAAYLERRTFTQPHPPGPGGGPPPLAFQLLIYPATDQRRGWPSHSTNGEGYLLTRDSMDYYHDLYFGDATHDLDWRASPLLHADHSRLPPALVLTAGYDPLRDE